MKYIAFFILVHGAWGEWTDWSLCSVSCEDGVKTRTRDCDRPEPQFGGLECVDQPNAGNDTDTESCNNGHCPS